MSNSSNTFYECRQLAVRYHGKRVVYFNITNITNKVFTSVGVPEYSVTLSTETKWVSSSLAIRTIQFRLAMI